MASALSRRGSYFDLADLRGLIDRAFEGGTAEGWRPAIDVVKEADAIVLHADIPGMKPDEVSVDVDGDVLTISGSHEESTEREEGDYIRRERRAGSFSRSLTLPAGVSADDIEATVEDGVLEVRVPVPAAREKKSISITPRRSSGEGE
jgi:HSP20 family protein